MSPGSPELSSDARKQLLYAVRRVLRPIVRLVIRVGMPFNEFADIARSAYIESAIRDRAGGTPLTHERVAFTTGMSRQQVDYYIDNEREITKIGPTLARVAMEVLHRWHTDPHYLGPYGIPLEFEFDAPHDRCFQSLVAQADSTASPGLVLEELLRAGSVVYSGEKHYRAVARWFIAPECLSPHRLENFGDTLAHLAQTLENNVNVAGSENKRLERFVFADKGIPRTLLSSFEAHARARALRFLGEMDDWLAHSDSGDSARSSPRAEAGVNVFLYVESPGDQQKLSVLVQPRRGIDAPAPAPQT
ncbi:MAG: DUF6502 family protein [Steroidobacteraceae bacterium]